MTATLADIKPTLDDIATAKAVLIEAAGRPERRTHAHTAMRELQQEFKRLAAEEQTRLRTERHARL